MSGDTPKAQKHNTNLFAILILYGRLSINQNVILVPPDGNGNFQAVLNTRQQLCRSSFISQHSIDDDDDRIQRQYAVIEIALADSTFDRGRCMVVLPRIRYTHNQGNFKTMFRASTSQRCSMTFVLRNLQVEIYKRLKVLSYHVHSWRTKRRRGCDVPVEPSLTSRHRLGCLKFLLRGRAEPQVPIIWVG